MNMFSSNFSKLIISITSSLSLVMAITINQFCNMPCCKEIIETNCCDSSEMPQNFDSRFSAIERRYSYVIYNSKNKPLFFDGFSHWVTNKLDTDKMESQLRMFLGEHNFTSFRSSGCNSKNPIKNISHVELKTFENFIIITIAANAFLQNMIRIMVGTILDIAKNEIDLTIEEILDKQDRQYAGKTAPAKGLFFLGPKYKDENNINSYVPNLFDRLKN